MKQTTEEEKVKGLIAIVKSGYIKENGFEIDPELDRFVDNYNQVYGHFKSRNCNRHDYHTIEVNIDDNYDWKEIEGSEKQIPDLVEFKKVTCKICHLQDYCGNADLDGKFHEGFTINKGKKLYWEMIWHSTGNVSVYSIEGNSARWIPGDTMITIHYKQ